MSEQAEQRPEKTREPADKDEKKHDKDRAGTGRERLQGESQPRGTEISLERFRTRAKKKKQERVVERREKRKERRKDVDGRRSGTPPA